MAKLTLDIALEFCTKPLEVTDKKTFQAVFLDMKKGGEYFRKCPPEELAFEVVSTNQDFEASFPFDKNAGGKGAVFEVALREDAPGLKVVIRGQFSTSIRAGLDKQLKLLGNELDLRVRGVMWKGGSYNGFMAWVEGSDHEQNKPNWRDGFPKINLFVIK